MPASVGAPHVCMSEHVWNTTYGLEDAVTIGEELTGELVGLSRQKHSTSIGTHNLGMYGPSIAHLALLIALLDGATGQYIGHVPGMRMDGQRQSVAPASIPMAHPGCHDA